MRDLYAFLSVVSTIASLLLIVFDVQKKMPVSFKGFFLMLSILSVLIFWGTSTTSDGSQIADNGEVSNTPVASSNKTEDNDLTDNQATQNTLNPSTDNSGDSGDLESTGDPSLIPGDQPNEEYSLQIAPIVSIAQNISPVTRVSSEVLPIEIIALSGEIYEDGQNIAYEFVPQTEGVHRLEFSNVPDGTDLQLEIYNSGWERIESAYDLDNGDGLTVSLSAGNTYYLRVQQYQNFGAYTLNIGPKKDIVDISASTEISDSIQYTDQENDYLFSPKIDGTYRFEFSNVPDGTDLQLEIYNSGWERIKSAYDLDNGDGITVSLSAGNTYCLRVQQYQNFGAYILNIGPQKDIVDISASTEISDSIQYTDQENDYLFSPKIDGTYRFEFSNVPDGTNLQLGVYNSGSERIKTDYDLDNGDGVTVSLASENTYFIRVSYYRGYGNYSLSIVRQDG